MPARHPPTTTRMALVEPEHPTMRHLQAIGALLSNVQTASPEWLITATREALNQLIYPREIHTAIPPGINRDGTEHNGRDHIEEHPPLLDLLLPGVMDRGGSARTRSSKTRILIDAQALELWAQIRDTARDWLRPFNTTWRDDLKHDLENWWNHYENAVLRGHIDHDREKDTLRQLEAWVDRIDTKYDPDEHREWTDACPAIIRTEDGEPRRCGARKALIDGDLHAAIDLNVSRLIARCRTCGTRWEGERGLMQLRYESNLWEVEREGAGAA